MTKVAQVGHVMMKDLREFRWLLAVYLGVAALATAHAVELKGFGNEAFGYLMLLVVLVGMIVVASFVQGDSPIRADAHWATRPFYPSAVLGAKFALAVVIVIGMPAVGQLAGLLVRHVAGRDLPGALGAEALEYGRWLLIAMVAGALARDLRTFIIIVLVAIPVSFSLITIWEDNRPHTQAIRSIHHAVFDLLPAIAFMTFVVGGAALLVHLYRTRDSRPRTWIAGCVVAFAGLVAGNPVPTAADFDLPAGMSGTTPRLSILPVAGTLNGVPQLNFKLSVDSLPAAQRLQLVDGVVVIHARGGAPLRVSMEGSVRMLHIQDHATTRLTWLGERQESHPTIGSASVPDTGGVRRAKDSGITSVGLDGRLRVSVPDFADTVPLRVGFILERSGERTRVVKWTYGLGQASISLSTEKLLLSIEQRESLALGQPFEGNDFEYALVNEARREAVVLEPHRGGSQNGWLVLPGTQTLSASMQLSTPTRDGVLRQLPPIDDDWFRGARLVITHWVPKGSYPVHSETAVP